MKEQLTHKIQNKANSSLWPSVPLCGKKTKQTQFKPFYSLVTGLSSLDYLTKQTQTGSRNHEKTKRTQTTGPACHPGLRAGIQNDYVRLSKMQNKANLQLPLYFSCRPGTMHTLYNYRKYL
jgi:hypothetical protein